ncbi:hypothetical protein MRX96_003554 [Rhipicephalus microplus]
MPSVPTFWQLEKPSHHTNQFTQSRQSSTAAPCHSQALAKFRKSEAYTGSLGAVTKVRGTLSALPVGGNSVGVCGGCAVGKSGRRTGGTRGRRGASTGSRGARTTVGHTDAVLA